MPPLNHGMHKKTAESSPPFLPLIYARLYPFRAEVQPYQFSAVLAFDLKDRPLRLCSLIVQNAPPAFGVGASDHFHLPPPPLTPLRPVTGLIFRLPLLIWNKGTSLPLPVPFYPLCFICFLPYQKFITPKTLRTFCRISIPAPQNPGLPPESTDSPTYV